MTCSRVFLIHHIWIITGHYETKHKALSKTGRCQITTLLLLGNTILVYMASIITRMRKFSQVYFPTFILTMSQAALPSAALGLCMRTLQEGCLRMRLQIKGSTISRAVGGAVKVRRDSRLTNAATR